MNDNKKAMRKLKLHVDISVDGCIAGPNNEMDWIDFTWNEELMEYENRLHEPVDTILLGRKMTNEFVSYWSNVMNKPDDPWNAFAKKMIETPKIVFTMTLDKSEWPNTKIATGDLKEEITKLKRQDGGDIIVYGGASFDSALIKENLIDEYYLFVNPVAIGNGKTIFKDLKEIRKLSLVESIAFDSGTVLLHYEVEKN
ncbi:dihydrofolate reductase family protein [Candidatus Nitrosocosmicus franklandus]|uniref:Bifunctional deaminase-reductase domain protein n=1 Tax=Candidatus Nitrosocosmicus franklandianus TaxID=1798806 RepID=A0A484I7E0_9ARCH|nr:dihydrofolate reductase family protein [Candidatus Nitrosocosmicus franklandus]VFJ13658.1 Bifunctional deaminase-reductase domain protein [Candidatus Nitrosocosmicus franklandus]